MTDAAGRSPRTLAIDIRGTGLDTFSPRTWSLESVMPAIFRKEVRRPIHCLCSSL